MVIKSIIFQVDNIPAWWWKFTQHCWDNLCDPNDILRVNYSAKIFDYISQCEHHIIFDDASNYYQFILEWYE